MFKIGKPRFFWALYTQFDALIGQLRFRKVLAWSIITLEPWLDIGSELVCQLRVLI